MSTTLEPILFCDDRLTIRPHSASSRGDLGRPVSLREFSAGGRVRVLQDTESGEYTFETADRARFVTGPWTAPAA